MGQLVMSFRGLWIHVNPNATRESPAPWTVDNVSAVNASNGADYTPQGFFPVALPPHFFSIEATDTVADRLTGAGLDIGNMGPGWRISLANASGDAPVSVNLITTSDAPQETPHLTTFDPPMQLAPVAEWRAAIVEISRGSVQATLFKPTPRNAENPGIYTTWTVETEDDPVLVFTPPPGSLLEPVSVLIPPPTPTDRPLPDGVPGSLVLHNSTVPSAPDAPWDFALYYLAAEGGIPETFAVPLPGTPPADSIPRLTGTKTYQIRLWLAELEVWLIEHLIIVAMDTGTSCSNSQYP